MNDDIEAKVIEEYKKGEREIGVFLDIISPQKVFNWKGGRTKILQQILAKHHIPMPPPLHTNMETKNRQRAFIREYKNGHRDLKFFASLEDLHYWSHTAFLKFFQYFHYDDMIICSKKEFDQERAKEINKVKMCKWLFESDDDTEYTMEELDAILERKFLHWDGEDKYGVRRWLEDFLVRCPNFQGYDEKKLRLVFKRVFDLWELTDRNNAILQSFSRFLPIILKEHHVTGFERWHKKDKINSDIKLDIDACLADNCDVEEVDDECLIEDEPLE